MVSTLKSRAGVFRQLKAWAIPASVGALAGAASLLTGASLAIAVLHVAAGAGIALCWNETRKLKRVELKASRDLGAIANRLIQLEQRIARSQNATLDPALRSTVVEVTGELSLLGGLVRDLADSVAAHDRDMDTLKQRLAQKIIEKPAALPRETAPVAESPVDPLLLPQTRRLASSADADVQRMGAIIQAFETDRLELHLQPIVALPQRKVKFYEAFARLRLTDDTVLVPAEFMPALERLDQIAELDRRMLERAISIARHLVARGSEAIVSVNLSPRSIDEPGFIRSIARLVDGAPDVAGKVVLELPQRCWRTLDAEKAGALAALRDKGVPFALDHATDLRIDPLALAERGVRFVKVAADLIANVDRKEGLDIELGDLSSVLRRAGIQLIAERVEHEEVVPDLIDLDIPLAQGFVFAPPRAVRSEVLQPQPVAKAEANLAPTSEPGPEESAPAQGTPMPEPEERKPFRAFLRRAV
jgi:cyclic-di-GMP phosphodiesterase TipF (flagellum assembly factor)